MTSNAVASAGADFFANQPQQLVPKIIFTAQAPALSQVIAQPYYINAAFASPSANNPTANSNMAFVFEGGPPVPSGVASVGSGVCAGTQINGNVTATPSGNPFYSEDYVIAFSVGPSVTPKSGATTYPNLAASAYIPGGVGSGQPVQYWGSALDFTPGGVSPTSIQWTYTLVPGTNPPANGAFIGLWNGLVNNNPYATAPQFVAQILNANQYTGSVIMNGLGLSIGSQYTAALFTSGYPLVVGAAPPTCIAAWIQFTLSAPAGG
jgi:hypothetical protein